MESQRVGDTSASGSAATGSPASNSADSAGRGRTDASGAGRVRTPLSLDRIVSVAIELIEAEGPDALSMRRLAARLGSSTMATYHHVADRQALMEAIAQRLMADLKPALEAGLGAGPSGESHLGGWCLSRRV